MIPLKRIKILHKHTFKHPSFISNSIWLRSWGSVQLLLITNRPEKTPDKISGTWLRHAVIQRFFPEFGYWLPFLMQASGYTFPLNHSNFYRFYIYTQSRIAFRLNRTLQRHTDSAVHGRNIWSSGKHSQLTQSVATRRPPNHYKSVYWIRILTIAEQFWIGLAIVLVQKNLVFKNSWV